MYKVIILTTHGIETVEGTAIHCHAAYNTRRTDFKSKFMYEPIGRLIRYQHEWDGEDIHVKMME